MASNPDEPENGPDESSDANPNAPGETTGQAEENERLQSPHNRFALGYMANPEAARGLLEAHLPQSLKEKLDLSQVTVENSHFIDERMAEFESDLLFRVPRIDGKRTNVFVYILWEHQRNRDSWMALRMWIYLGLLYRYLVQSALLTPEGKLPFVYPIVLYQGTEGWEKGLVLEDLIDHEGLAQEDLRWMPRFSVDLLRLDSNSPRVHPTEKVARLGVGAMRAVMKKVTEAWLREHLGELDNLFATEPGPVILILTYLVNAGEDLTNEKFREIMGQGKYMKWNYLPNSIVGRMVREKEEREEKWEKEKREWNEEKQRMIDARIGTVKFLIGKGMSDQEVFEATTVPMNEVAEIRRTEQA